MNRYLAGGLGLLALGSAALASTTVQAMPTPNITPAMLAPEAVAPSVEKAFVVCGPFRCFHRGWGGRHRYYGWHRPWGWHRYGWHRWHRW